MRSAKESSFQLGMSSDKLDDGLHEACRVLIVATSSSRNQSQGQKGGIHRTTQANKQIKADIEHGKRGRRSKGATRARVQQCPKRHATADEKKER